MRVRRKGPTMESRIWHSLGEYIFPLLVGSLVFLAALGAYYIWKKIYCDTTRWKMKTWIFIISGAKYRECRHYQNPAELSNTAKTCVLTFIFLIGGKLLYSVVLVSAVQQLWLIHVLTFNTNSAASLDLCVMVHHVCGTQKLPHSQCILHTTVSLNFYIVEPYAQYTASHQWATALLWVSIWAN